jgi:PKD repeat protein
VEAARFLVSSTVTAGAAAAPLVGLTARPAKGRAPLKTVFQIQLDPALAPVGWEIVFGDGNVLRRSGSPPRFAGHTYRKSGSFAAILIVDDSTGGRLLTHADLTVSSAPTGVPPPARATTVGTVLVNGRAFTGGLLPYRSRVDVTNGRLVLRTDAGTVTVYGGGALARFVLLHAVEGGRPTVVLQLTGGDFSVCKKRKTSSLSKSAPPTKTIRRLWGNGKGRFRTRGRNAAALSIGTIWLTADRCDGTLVSVTRGRVSVRDFPKRRTIVVRAGSSYLAKSS